LGANYHYFFKYLEDIKNNKVKRKLKLASESSVLLLFIAFPYLLSVTLTGLVGGCSYSGSV
jgi:hypothetical protein